MTSRVIDQANGASSPACHITRWMTEVSIRILSWLILIQVLIIGVSTNMDAADVDLIILAGQSNAQGWQGNAERYPADTLNQDAKIRFYWNAPGMSSSNGSWTTMQKQGGRFKTGHFGLEVTFARALLAHGGHPAIFKYSRGSTSIAKNWKLPGKGGMYDDMVKELTKAIALLRAEGHTVRNQGFIWIQGESDAQTPEMAQAFESSLLAIINDLSNRVLNTPNCPVLLGLDERHSYVLKNPEVITAQLNLAKTLSCCARTSMEKLEKADGTHLSPAGLVLHGERVFQDYVALTEAKPKIP